MASNALTTAGRFGSSQATEPADRGQRFPQIVVSAFRGPVQFVMHGASLFVRSNATACRIRPHVSVRGVGGVKGWLRRASPALDPAQTPNP